MSKAGASATDRHLRRELLRLRADLQRQELGAAAQGLRESAEPALRAGRFLVGLSRKGPVVDGLQWVREHPLAGSVISVVVARLSGAAARQVVTRGLPRLVRLALGGASAAAVGLAVVRWWRRSPKV